VEFVLNDRRTVTPLVEAAVKTPGTAGLHAIRLADFGASLEKEVDYEWFVQLRSRTERPAPDTYGGGQIRRVAAPADLPVELAKADARRAQVLAQRSLWYDALAALSGEIDASPGDAALHAQRAGLLESVGLGDTAASDRRSASTQP
jgi:hypothetical protein